MHVCWNRHSLRSRVVRMEREYETERTLSRSRQAPQKARHKSFVGDGGEGNRPKKMSAKGKRYTRTTSHSRQKVGHNKDGKFWEAAKGAPISVIPKIEGARRTQTGNRGGRKKKGRGNKPAGGGKKATGAKRVGRTFQGQLPKRYGDSSLEQPAYVEKWRRKWVRKRTLGGMGRARWRPCCLKPKVRDKRVFGRIRCQNPTPRTFARQTKGHSRKSGKRCVGKCPRSGGERAREICSLGGRRGRVSRFLFPERGGHC